MDPVDFLLGWDPSSTSRTPQDQVGSGPRPVEPVLKKQMIRASGLSSDWVRLWASNGFSELIWSLDYSDPVPNRVGHQRSPPTGLSLS